MQQENAHTQAHYSDNSGPKQKYISFIDVGNEPPESTDIGHDENPEPGTFKYAISSFATSRSDMTILDSGDRFVERIHETGAT